MAIASVAEDSKDLERSLDLPMSDVINIDGKKVLVKHAIFTWSNFISLSRVLIGIPIVLLHFHNGLQVDAWILALIAYAILSDYLDGLVARLTREISELGKILDPIADKLLAFILFVYTVWLGWIPLWFFLLGVVRDLLIMLGSYYIKKVRGKVAMSTLSGKISVNVLAAYWIAVFFFRDAQEVHSVFMIGSLVMMAISFVAYFRRYQMILRGAEFN